MTIRFSDKGPAFPEQLVDAMLSGEVVFLCGAGVSAPQLPGFGKLVSNVFAKLNVEMTASETLSFNEYRFEEALGSLSRRIVHPGDMIRAVVEDLQPPVNADLSHHMTVLRLSRDLANRPAIVTTNFDTLIERALVELVTLEEVRALSFAGQDLPPPGSADFGGIIHLHGRIADDQLGLDETPLVVTSADYGDAYMRSGWASRFLFDLCRCRTIVLLGYSAGDAPVRYFLNVLEADRQRFPDLRPVYAIDAVESRDQADVRWAALAVEPIVYEYLPDEKGKHTRHDALWPDLDHLADLVEKPRAARREWANDILSKQYADATSSELDHAAWLFSGRRDLWSLAIPTITDSAWFEFFAERKLWSERDAAWILAAWMAIDLESPERFRKATEWLERLGRPFADELSRSLRQAKGTSEVWMRFWRLLTISRPERGNHWEDRAYFLIEALTGPILMNADLERAVGLLTPVLEVRSSRGFFDTERGEDPPRRLSDLSWPHLTVADRGGASDLVDALLRVARPIQLMEIAGARLRSTVGLSIDMGLIGDDYDGNDFAVPSVESHAQNEHHDGPIFLVDLLARLLPGAVAADREAARAQALGWKSMPGILGIRLWLHALRNSDLFTADEAIASLNGLGLNPFWSIRRELALVLRDRAGTADQALIDAVEQRILTEGDQYYARYTVEEGQADWRSHAQDAEVWLLLRMLQQAARLSANGEVRLGEIEGRRGYLAREVEDQDFFGSYTSPVHMVVGDAQPIINADEGERLQVAQQVIGSPDIEKQQGWSTFCRTDPVGALDTLRAAPLEEVNAPLWRDLMNALAFPEPEVAEGRRALIVDVFAALEPAEPAFLSSVAGQLSGLYSVSPRRAEPAIAAWWPRLFAAAVEREADPIDATRDLYADLINTAAGKLTQAALVDIDAERNAGAEIPPALLQAIEGAAKAPGRHGAMARGALVFAAGFILTIDGEQVTPLLDAALGANSDEGAALRRVLVTDSRVSITTSRVFARHILRGLLEVGGRGKELANAAAKIVAPALSIVRGEKTAEEWGFGIAEASRALRDGPLELRQGAARLLSQWIHQIGDDRAQAWRTGIGPLIAAIWPRERSLLDRSLSSSFADVAVASADAFPEALEQLLPLMSLLEGHGGAYAIEKSQAPEKFTRETLILLWKLFGPGTTGDLHGVPAILDRLVAAVPAIEVDRRLQWLDQKAVRYE